MNANVTTVTFDDAFQSDNGDANNRYHFGNRARRMAFNIPALLFFRN